MIPRRPGLLVSVRSAEEARDAHLGGASVIDVKEPGRGPLGAADPSTWREVRQAVPPEVPVSVALGELGDWRDLPTPPADGFAGIAFRKLGLARSGPGWRDAWHALRCEWGGDTPWIAVVYSDWERAQSPPPHEVIEAAARASCAGVLIDTWDKARGPRPIDPRWIERIRRGSGLAVIAGGLDARSIARLRPLRPDLFAVRGAACKDGDRLQPIDRDRVAALVGSLSDA